MANWGNMDFGELLRLQQRLEAMASQQEQQRFYEGVTKEVAARFLGKVIRKTPVGENVTAEEATGETYKTGKRKGKPKTKKVVIRQGGTLRRGWTAVTEADAENGSSKDPASFAAGLQPQRNGSTYTVTITNPVHYASYVENGHRQEPGRYVPAIGKSLKKSWVEGQHFMRDSENEVKAELPAVLQRRLDQFLNRGMNG